MVDGSTRAGEHAYSVTRVLGRGGSGVVSLALDAFGREVALKRVALGGSAHEIEQARARLRREAEVLRRLEHPGIVPLLDVVDDGTDVVLVMPYFDGGNLADRVRRDRPTVAEVIDIAGALARALAYAHEHGVVHRDVNPRNVLFTQGGACALADFGIATTTAMTVGLTPNGMVVGTPGYLAPEVAHGEPSGPPADVFGLGATLSYALNGLSAPRWLQTLVRRMADPDPQRRPSMQSVADVFAFSPATGATAMQPPRRARWRPRRIRPGVMATAVGLVMALAVGVWALARDDAPVAEAGTGCADRPYQPCGAAEPAPFTDGLRCIADHDDYDGDAANGCEAAPDVLEGVAVEFGTPRVANLVPTDDVDIFPIEIADHLHLTCDGTVEITLTSAAGTTQRAELRNGDSVLAEVESRNAGTASAAAVEPSCFGSDAGRYELVVESVEGRSAGSYTLEVSGSF